MMGVPIELWASPIKDQLSVTSIYSLLVAAPIVLGCQGYPMTHVLSGAVIAGASFLGYFFVPKFGAELSTGLLHLSPLVLGLIWVAKARRRPTSAALD
jgi:hypothetical protein